MYGRYSSLVREIKSGAVLAAIWAGRLFQKSASVGYFWNSILTPMASSMPTVPGACSSSKLPQPPMRMVTTSPLGAASPAGALPPSAGALLPSVPWEHPAADAVKSAAKHNASNFLYIRLSFFNFF